MSAKKNGFIDKIVSEVEKVAKENIPDYENKKKKVLDTFKDEKTKKNEEYEEVKEEFASTTNNNVKKYCSNCGEELDEDDKFCDSCGKEVKKKKATSKKKNEDGDKVKTKKCPNCGASIKAFQTSCKYCQAELTNIKVSNSLEEFSKGLEKIKAKPMPKFEGKDSLLKKVIGKDFKDEDEREEFENNFLEQKDEEIANYITNFPIPNSTEDLTEFMILVTSNIDLKKESDDIIQKAWKSKMNQIYEKAKLSITKESDLKVIRDLFEKKNSEIKNKKIINGFKITAGIVGWFALLGLIANPLMTVIVCLFIAGIMLTVFSTLINKDILPNNMKLNKKRASILSYICFILAILILVISWILSNPIVSIGIILLIIALSIFIYYLLIEKNKVKNKFNLTKKLTYIICGILAGISLILFIGNAIGDIDFSSKSNTDKNDIVDQKNDKQDEKKYSIDYYNAENFEKDLNDGKKVKDKIVLFYVKDYKPESAMGVNTWAGEHLNFISEDEIDVETGYYVLGKVTKEPKDVLGSWRIEYEVLEIYKEKPSIKEEPKEESNENETEDKKDENKDEDETISDDEEDKSNTIIMIVPVEDYIGTDYKELKKELESYGVTNIVVESIETKDSKNKNETIKEFTINGKTYKPFDEFKKDDEFKIIYWNLIEEKNTEIKEILLPKEDSKLAKDFDSKSERSVIYLNTDNIKNTPSLKKWGKAYVTDGIANYLDFLVEKGFKVEITNYSTKTPYSGFTTYDVDIKVSNKNISWTMECFIQKEKYVEYEFYINLKD